VLTLILTGCGQIAKETGVSQSSSNDKPSLQATAQALPTPETCMLWMNGHIRYQPDGAGDEYRDPQVTYDLGYGDCDDYAMFASYVLRQHGYETQVLSVFTATTGHTVCVWKDAAGRYDYISNTGIKKISAASLPDIAADIYSDWTICLLPETNKTIARH
jgi:predicted transglutaminase-like cysteine proteinase